MNHDLVHAFARPPAVRASRPARSAMRLNAFVIAAALAGGLVAGLPAQANSVVAATGEDTALANSVQAALLKNPVFQAANVDITVRAWKGKVNLSGWISDVNDDALARKTAASVGGVRTVISNFRSWSTEGEDRSGVAAASSATSARAASVVGATEADMALATNVQTALMKERAFQAADVEIVVRASTGKVNLSGWVTDVKDDALARKIAASVTGVKMVSTNFHSWSTDGDDRSPASNAPASPRQQSVVGSSPEDLALAGNVRAAVMQSPAFKDADVDIVVRAAHGRVNLSGWVSYANNDQMARKIAAAVPGVKSVTSDFRSWSTDEDPRR